MDSEDLLFNAMQSGASGSASERETAPAGTTMLGTASPDPFAASTSMLLTLASGGHVTLGVHDSAGRRVRTLLDGEERAGQRVVTWDGCDDRGAHVTDGVYELRIVAAGQQESRTVQRRSEQEG